MVNGGYGWGMGDMDGEWGYGWGMGDMDGKWGIWVGNRGYGWGWGWQIWMGVKEYGWVLENMAPFLKLRLVKGGGDREIELLINSISSLL